MEVGDEGAAGEGTSNDEGPREQKKGKKIKEKKEVYLPNKKLDEGEELVCDESAYVILRQVQTGMLTKNIYS